MKQQADSANATAAKEAETLKVPEALPTPNVEEQVNIPVEELEPPEVEVTPTVTE